MLFGKPKGLPVLALRDVVVFPFETKALVVARPQSVANLLKADSEDKSMLLVMQQDAVQVNPTLSELHKVGTLAKILQVLRLPDNKYRVLVRGEARVSIDKLEQQDLLWLGSHTNIEVDQGTSKENDVLKLDIDPKSHYAWTGGTQKILDKGRVSKYNKKFSNLRSKK